MGTAAKKFEGRKHESSVAPAGNIPSYRRNLSNWDQMGLNPSRSGYNFLKNFLFLSTIIFLPAYSTACHRPDPRSARGKRLWPLDRLSRRRRTKADGLWTSIPPSQVPQNQQRSCPVVPDRSVCTTAPGIQLPCPEKRTTMPPMSPLRHGETN